MKKNLFLAAIILLSFTGVSETLSAQQVGRAQTPTTKGLIDKKSTFSPATLDSLLKCDKFVMLILSYEGCIPCEILRTSDVFDRFPITPYYIDYRLNNENATPVYTFSASGFPTCMIFDKSGKIVAITLGANHLLYERLEKIVNGENLIDRGIPGVPDDQILPFVNLMHKANIACLQGNMESVYQNATAAMNICPNFYNRYLLYKYYLSKADNASANKYKQLALENIDDRDKFVFKPLIDELKD